MSAYIKLSTLEYPRHIGDIQIDPAGMADYALVQWDEPPVYDVKTQLRHEGPPMLKDGQWFMTWIVRPLTEEEAKIQATMP